MDPTLVRKARLFYAGFVVLGCFLVALNHYLVVTDGEANFGLLFLGPFVAGLFGAGLIDPRAPFAIGAKGRHYPLRPKILGAAGALGGLAVSALLAFYYQGII